MESLTMTAAPTAVVPPTLSIRKLATEQFGEILDEERHIFTFPNGLLGFEELREFIIVRDERTEPVRWLLSVEHPELSFPVMSPYLLLPSYSPGNDYCDHQRFTPLVILTLSSEGATANLKAPIVLDVQNQRGVQIIIPSDKYSTQYPLGIQQSSQR